MGRKGCCSNNSKYFWNILLLRSRTEHFNLLFLCSNNGSPIMWQQSFAWDLTFYFNPFWYTNLTNPIGIDRKASSVSSQPRLNACLLVSVRLRGQSWVEAEHGKRMSHSSSLSLALRSAPQPPLAKKWETKNKKTPCCADHFLSKRTRTNKAWAH